MNRAMIRVVALWASCTVVAAPAKLNAGAQETPPSTAIERALTERICDGLFAARPTDLAGHESCVADQLTALRADFGRDLSRLSASDRRKLDATCSPLEKAEARERYLDCVNAQLTALRERLHRGRAAAAGATPETPSPQALALPAASPARQATSWMWWIVAPVAIGGAIAGAVVLVRKRRPPATYVCSACGAPVADAGALCAACRHEAAEARRRAAAERVAEADQQQQQQAAAAENAEREREVARRTALEAETREREEAARRQHEQEEEDARKSAAAPSAPAPASEEDESFDPYQILGIPPDADDEAIRTAYEAAKAKYDAGQVSHLSPEVQHHYKAKAAAVELAYQTLTAT